VFIFTKKRLNSVGAPHHEPTGIQRAIIKKKGEKPCHPSIPKISYVLWT
jgi:hypothetical protein